MRRHGSQAAHLMRLPISAHFSERKEQGREIFLLRTHYERQNCFRRLAEEAEVARECCQMRTAGRNVQVQVGQAGME